jgi:hypothetical protein
MKKINLVLFALLISVSTVLTITSCKKKSKCNEIKISFSGSDESHNFGQNCLQCHKSGGEGEGCFTVAGSVSNSSLTSPLSSGTVSFYSAPNGGGTLMQTVEIDAKGNFHTTDAFEISGLYPAITGSNGITHYMSSSPSTGACNSCHGSSTTKLFAN